MKYSEFDFTKSLDIILKLNELVGKGYESREEIENELTQLFKSEIKLKINDIITSENEGPIYYYTTEINSTPTSIYLGDLFPGHFIIAVKSGSQATYLNEHIKNLLKVL
jgi:hypothetical protein